MYCIFFSPPIFHLLLHLITPYSHHSWSIFFASRQVLCISIPLSLSQSSTIFHYSIFHNSINSSQEFLKIQSEGPKSSVRIHWTSGWVQGSRSPICSSPSVDTVPVYIISSPAIIARYLHHNWFYPSIFVSFLTDCQPPDFQMVTS